MSASLNRWVRLANSGNKIPVRQLSNLISDLEHVKARIIDLTADIYGMTEAELELWNALDDRKDRLEREARELFELRTFGCDPDAFVRALT